MNISLKLLIGLSLTLATFLLGAAFQRYQPYPYDLMYKAFIVLKYESVEKMEVANAKTDKARHAARILEQKIKRSKNPFLGDVRRSTGSINSAYLPLIVNKIEVSRLGGDSSDGNAKDGGAIAYKDDRLFIVDIYGNFATYDFITTELKELVLPKLETTERSRIAISNIIDPKPKMIFDIVIAVSKSTEEYVIYCSYASNNPTTGFTELVISTIRIDKKSNVPNTKWEDVFVSDAFEKGSLLSMGGRMFVNDHLIYLTIGDANIDRFDGVIVSQDKSNTHGSILKIERESLKVKTISIGHRNPQGIWKVEGDGIYATEHGPRGGDELNFIKQNGNYGWPFQSNGTDYLRWSLSDLESTFSKDTENFIEPIFSWVPAIAVSSLVGAEDFHERWSGNLIAGSLKAKSLFRIVLGPDKNVIYVEPIPVGARVREAVMASGRTGKYIAILTDSSSLLLISVDKEKLALDSKEISKPSLRGCFGKCHHLGPTNSNHMAPSLSSVFGRPIAGDNFSSYSSGLKTIRGKWTELKLMKFLTDPQKFAEGTLMPNQNLTSTKIDKIIDALKD